MIEPARPTRFEKKKNMRINFAEETGSSGKLAVAQPFT